MPQIIDELIVLLKLDSRPFKKAAAEQAQTIQATTKKIKISAEDQKRIEDSQEVTRTKREKDRVRKQKGADREAGRSAQEFGDKVKNVALGITGAFLGFESLKGAVTFLGNLNASTAALGRNSANLGNVSAHDLQTWGLAVEQIGGDSKEAVASFGSLSQQLTALKLRGEVGPLIQFFQNLGIYVRDAAGNVKDLTSLLGEIPGAAQKRGLSRQDAFNLASSAGVSEGVFNLLYDKDREGILRDAGARAFATQHDIDQAQKGQRKIAGVKQAITGTIGRKFYDAVDNPLGAYRDALLSPIEGPIDLFQQAFGTAGATAGVRNNNPGNLEDRKGRQRRFGSLAEGAGALSSDIDYKIDRDHLNTMRKIISKYAPAGDGNDVEAYLKDVSKRTGIGIDSPISSREDRFKLVDAMMAHEQGPKGYAQITRALSTPGAGGATTNHNAGGNVTTVSIARVEVNTQATDANGIATDFMGAMNRKGILPQANTGMTP